MKNYTATIEVAKSGDVVFNRINDVSKWWAAEANGIKSEVTGQSKKLNDEFTMRFGDSHYSKQKLIEFIPNKKIVWLVVESKINWIEKDKEEWTNMKMIFEIAPKGNNTLLTFTQEGLVPEKECYDKCSKSWDRFIKDRLFNFIATGDYKCSIAANITAQEAFKGICRVNEWWGHIEGKTEKVNDTFTYRPNDTWVNFKITECNEKKIVWHVTDCYLPWLNNKREWLHTDVVFEIEEKGNLTQINFTHIGLVPEVECYENCVIGWTHYIKTSLLQFLKTGKGQIK